MRYWNNISLMRYWNNISSSRHAYADCNNCKIEQDGFGRPSFDYHDWPRYNQGLMVNSRFLNKSLVNILFFSKIQ